MDMNLDLKEVLKTFFKDKVNTDKKTLTIVSTYQLTIEDLALIKKIFSLPADFKIINLVDPKILGGMIFKLGSKIIDLSIVGQLKKFKQLIEVKD